MADKAGLLVVSNRGPISFVGDGEGGLQPARAAGGLVVTLGPGAQRDGALWLASAASEEDRAGAEHGAVSTGGFTYRPVVVDPEDFSAYYDVVANQTLWFCVHGLWDRPRRPRFDRYWWRAWERYQAVNESFASAADQEAAEGATVLVQDYQLSLVPGMLATRRPDLSVVAFVHTPWCSPQELSTLPDEVARAVVSGLSGGRACGFHSARWAAAFSQCCEAFLGRPAEVFVAAAATDAHDLRSVARSGECATELDRLEEAVAGRRVIARVDRMEPSKNLLRGFWAFDELLENRRDLRGEVVFTAMAYPSRVGLAEYQSYGQEVLGLAAQINAKWSRPGWTPVVLDTEDNYPRSVAALRRFDVLLVNPVRDGLNLVSFEGPLVNERDGVLVLSRQAGAWDTLGPYALGVNPFDISQTADAVGRALDLAPAERAAMASQLREAAAARSPLDWFDDLLQRSAASVS